MIEIGRMHTLVIEDLNDRGAILLLEGQRVLLPQREVAASNRIGQEMTVFVYRGRQEQLIATLSPPKAQVGEFALLEVSQANQYGAFLDWGLDKELMVPFAEQPERMRVGRSYIVYVGLDNSGRLIGSGRIDRHLEIENIKLKTGDEVEVMIWQLTDLGAKVIINNRYGGLIYKSDLPPGARRGEKGTAYVQRVREDNLIDICMHKVGKAGLDEAKDVVMAALQELGRLPLTDKSSPTEIEQLLGLSKKAFKRALGGLYKQGMVVLEEDGVRLK
ncbi:MAG: GntR family transcriptional regulator [Desulfuromonas sp.]|nr:GntR family transcriptional regulator [Desulfuromonas sp.]